MIDEVRALAPPVPQHWILQAATMCSREGRQAIEVRFSDSSSQPFAAGALLGAERESESGPWKLVVNEPLVGDLVRPSTIAENDAQSALTIASEYGQQHWGPQRPWLAIAETTKARLHEKPPAGAEIVVQWSSACELPDGRSRCDDNELFFRRAPVQLAGVNVRRNERCVADFIGPAPLCPSELLTDDVLPIRVYGGAAIAVKANSFFVVGHSEVRNVIRSSTENEPSRVRSVGGAISVTVQAPHELRSFRGVACA